MTGKDQITKFKEQCLKLLINLMDLNREEMLKYINLIIYINN